MSAASVSDPGVRPLLADAVDLARGALVELEPSAVGAHLGVAFENETAATHRFEATLPGYRGWQWAVVVAAAPEAGYATVSESALLPGPDALVAPAFVPWEQRVRPGDLAPGDLLAPPTDDPRLAPGYVATGDPVVDEVGYDVGLGRSQVLSREGREDAAERWYTEFGPDTEMAKAAPSTCGLCGFFVPLAGALRAAFGVCGNAMGADGHVVHNAYGCGAHSDTAAPSGGGSPIYEAYDDAAFDVVEVRGSRRSAATGTDAPDSNASVVESTGAESVTAETPSAETASSRAIEGASAPESAGGEAPGTAGTEPSLEDAPSSPATQNHGAPADPAGASSAVLATNAESSVEEASGSGSSPGSASSAAEGSGADSSSATAEGIGVSSGSAGALSAGSAADAESSGVEAHGVGSSVSGGSSAAEVSGADSSSAVAETTSAPVHSAGSDVGGASVDDASGATAEPDTRPEGLGAANGVTDPESDRDRNVSATAPTDFVGERAAAPDLAATRWPSDADRAPTSKADAGDPAPGDATPATSENASGPADIDTDPLHAGLAAGAVTPEIGAEATPSADVGVSESVSAGPPDPGASGEEVSPPVSDESADAGEAAESDSGSWPEFESSPRN
ncbi:DUF3027 domain-containing protein [Nocardia callitridis]|uniref:DUF3027 domain-containing protein n=1 Tax=Nocardia callitridis TaxID=648753 RepID=A0ABP9KUE9_9NOCA